MRLAIVRQHYHPDGGVERVFERALEALLERNVAISLYTRSWPQTRLQLIEPVICDPLYAGTLWRDWGFARAACRAISPLEAESRRIARALALLRRLPRRRRRARGLARGAAEGRVRAGTAPPPGSRRTTGTAAHRRAPLREPVAARGDLQIEDGPRRDHRTASGCRESKLHVIYNPVDSDVFHPALRAVRAAVLERHGIDEAATVFLLRRIGLRACGAGAAIDALAELPPPAHLIDRRARPARGALSRARASASASASA